MTRAEEILALCEVQASKPGAAFKGQWRYAPGQKMPVHLQRRKQKLKDTKTRSMRTYERPWSNQKTLPRDKISRPLDKHDETPVRKTR